ncbi:MAG: pyruvate kinase [Candidatus Moranbacteria bacterium]|nr:pyruvate kinase [Candidatus Moranbacteria bacterium]MDD3964582.1 pyruvate kinase [Candidatus Moranbacteria bacterium]
MKQTKIVATIGPASESKEMLRKMILAGMNVVRLNFSHGAYEWHKAVIDRVRELSLEMHVPIAILADIQGPRIRTEVKEEIVLVKGDRIRLSDIAKKEVLADSEYPTALLDMAGMIDGVDVNHSILIEDGTMELVVREKGADFVLAEAKNDGVIKNRKGVTLPDSHLELSILSEKDRNDVRFVVEQEVDYIGLSFVGSARDIAEVRELIQNVISEGSPVPKIVSKIERKEAIRNLTEIIKGSDAVMVARGDLGIEMPESEVAILQKQIIAESLRAAKPVIVATQMLKSMTENPRPTRAEVSDVSNAVIDHADAVMLSEESAMGKYPVEAIAMMAEIIEKTEESPFDDMYKTLNVNFQSETATMMRSVYELAKSFHVQAILLFSVSGHAAKLLSHFRPENKIFVATKSRNTYNELALVWGVNPYVFENDEETEDFITHLMEVTKNDGKLMSGDQVVIFHGRTKQEDNMKLVGIKEIR